MAEPTYQKRWEIINDLGEGGQGAVKLVRDLKDFPSREKVRKALAGVSSLDLAVSESKKEQIVTDVLELIRQLSRQDAPENCGALKVLNDVEKLKDAGNAATRIRREIEAMSSVDHPNLLKILDSDAENLWYVSKYHPLGTLEAIRTRFKGDVPGTLRAVRPLVEAVALLHSQNKPIVHRDIKAKNIFVASDSSLVLGDFGIVYFMNSDHTAISLAAENPGSSDWMPKWAKAKEPGQATPQFDVFCLGKLIWWMISGSPIGKLELWYFDHPKCEHSLDRLFPDNKHIAPLKKLLGLCVVEWEDNCVSNAQSLLKHLDVTLDFIEAGADILSDPKPRKCKVCGHGEFIPLNPRFCQSVADVSNYPQVRIRIESCDHCGYMQMFSASDDDRSKPNFFWNNVPNAKKFL
ncbi:MAG: protein kinase [Planctomycetota bacterium]|nr:protein kinase [Planctomycetota bacterium]